MMSLDGDWFRDSVMEDFEDLSDFITHSEAQLQESHHTHRAAIISQRGLPSSDTGQDAQIAAAIFSDDVNEVNRGYQIVFGTLMRYSMVLLCFSLIESRLSEVASEIARRKHLDLKMEDLQAKDLVKRFQ